MFYNHVHDAKLNSRWNLSQSVLVVDDEPMARTLLRLMLVRSGYEVIEAVDGYDALRKLNKHAPDLVILDVMMPGMDGFEVCATIRQSYKDHELPIIMLSAKSDLQSAQTGLDAGATKYLTKPVSPDDLTRHVIDILQTTNSNQMI